MDREGMDKYVSAEMCQTFNRHWGIGAEDFNYTSPRQIIENLCACRKVGANYLLNVGPTAGGGIPDYESAALRRVGEWISGQEDVLYGGRPCDVQGTGADFALQADGRLYLFVHNLSVGGDAHVSTGGGGGPRDFTAVTGDVGSVHWLDNDEELDHTYDARSGLLSVDATGYPYGVDRVVRVAEVR
jgi:alpha-L-fucosidase